MKLLAVALAALQLLPSLALAQGAPALDGRLKKIQETGQSRLRTGPTRRHSV